MGQAGAGTRDDKSFSEHAEAARSRVSQAQAPAPILADVSTGGAERHTHRSRDDRLPHGRHARHGLTGPGPPYTTLRDSTPEKASSGIQVLPGCCTPLLYLILRPLAYETA